MTPETVVVYSTINGLDYVSMGALTHSAPALDLSLLLETARHDPAPARQHPRHAGRGARARRRARRRDPRAQLPAARDPGRGRLRRRLARPLDQGGRRRRGRDRVLRRALHGRDGLDPVARTRPCCCPTSTPAARSPTRSRADAAARLEGQAPGRRRRDVRQHDRGGQGRDRLLRHVRRTPSRSSSTSTASTAPDTEILFGPDMFLGAYVEKVDRPHDARLGRRVPRPRRHPPARHRARCAPRTRAPTS